ncbi:MAG: class I SAM-dependent methyltransferase [Candidatus Magasanikbacteria bacterium]|jgi:SAM-dependent methyltransferase|nr:class I SAM-dependent methyltransferase [Candidatus Magasanikbacteria bacterium]MBT4314822.1 class I SAM-dependent methyltransferase [Candidatus Magasanikbacteria bacterium]MBT4547599.1 class I SAM-dependent methyltransferase [Candidatus Magasanikbacteria bacterium]MBT6819229.1 class I SAM-dependent methyltransferase [Candidatus Magasanikbacteria bacterium]
MDKIDNSWLIAQVDCTVCSGKSKIIDNYVQIINKNCDDKVSLRECSICSHWWIDPMPRQEVLSKWYGEGSGFVVYPPGYSGTSPDNIYAEKIFSRLTRCIDKTEFNYLEIGCGSGNLLKYFSERADMSYGVEPGWWGKSEKLKVVQDVNDLPVGVRFDIIVFGDVLEHVADPKSMIKKVSKVANEDAIIYLNFPNKDCLKARMMKGKWGMVLPFGHLNFFSSGSIDYICEKSGLKILNKKAVRAGNENIISLIKKFDWSEKKRLFRLIKSLLLGQIILGKDQWDIILKK